MLPGCGHVDQGRGYEIVEGCAKLDKIIVGMIAIVAAAYLFRRFRAMAGKKNICRECGTCGSVCGIFGKDCEGNRRI